MKIAILTSGILPVPAVQGGAVENLIDYYLEYNNQHKLHDITVYSVAPCFLTRKKKGNTRFHYIHMKSPWHRLKRIIFKYYAHKKTDYDSYIEYFFHECLRHIRFKPYDVIILENRPGYTVPLFLNTDAKIFIHLHNDFMNDSIKGSLANVQACHFVITVSDFIKSRVETLANYQRISKVTNRIISYATSGCEPADLSAKIRTVHNGINLKRFYKATSRSRFFSGFSKKDFIVVYSGRINPDKGIRELIQAFKRLKDYPNIKLLIVGGSFFGNQKGNDPFIQSLQAEAKELAKRISFTGYVSHKKIPSYLKMANVAVVPSMWDDPFPTTILEAMAAGTPIIATDSGGIKEACSECAIILEKSSIVEGLCNSILQLYNDPSRCIAMSERGLAISKQYAKERYAKEFFDTIESSLNKQ